MKISGNKVFVCKEPFEAEFTTWREYYLSDYYHKKGITHYEADITPEWVDQNRLIKGNSACVLTVHNSRFVVHQYKWDALCADIVYTGIVIDEDGHTSGRSMTQSYLLILGAIHE